MIENERKAENETLDDNVEVAFAFFQTISYNSWTIEKR